MKFEPLTKKDFTDATKYKAMMLAGTDIDRSYADILNDLGSNLFSDFDCLNITEPQLTELNRLIQLGKQIMDTYIPQQDQTNINLATFPAYLFKACRDFCMAHVSPERLKAARDDEDANHDGRKLKCGTRVFLYSDICPDYLPRQIKSHSRETFKKEYGVYSENIFIAVAFYVTPYVLGIKPAHQGCDDRLLQMVLANTKPILHHQKCGSHKKNIPHYNLDDQYEIFKHNVLAGKYYGLSACGIIDNIRKHFKLSHRQAHSLVVRFNDEHKIKRITNFTKK